MTSDQRQGLEAASRRASSYATKFVGSLISAWQVAHHGHAPNDALTTDVGTLMRLSLCLRPRADHWAHDIAEIALATGLSPDSLDTFLREGARIERLLLAHPTAPEIDGRLLAARDHADEDE